MISKSVKDYATGVVDDWEEHIESAAVDELVYLRELADRVRKMAVDELERRGGVKK